MTHTNISSIDNAAADEAVIAFVEAGDAADLSEWMRRYPEHGSRFASVAADRWAGIATGAGAESTDVAPEAVARFKAFAQDIAASRRMVPVAAPIASLVAAARERGLDAQSLAKQLQIPYAVFFKLHRRLIDPFSIPRKLVDQLSDALGRTAQEVAVYFRMPPTLAAGASYRADQAPQAGRQQSFADALATDPDATAEQVAFYAPAPGDEA